MRNIPTFFLPKQKQVVVQDFKEKRGSVDRLANGKQSKCLAQHCVKGLFLESLTTKLSY
jgi:hypothetical protein